MLLQLEHVSKRFADGVRAVDDVSLAVEAGEAIALVGPSGCGKTTLLRLIAGLDVPTDGRIVIDGRDARSLRPRDRQVAMVFQNAVLFPHLTAFDNIAFGLRLRGVAKQEIAQRVTEAAEWLQVSPLLGRRPHELSGGERQRVALGRSVVGRPKLFLFDEPLSNLDAWLKADLRAQIAHLHHRLGAAMLLVSHDPADALEPGRRVLMMRHGRIEPVDKPAKLFADLLGKI
jgi:ABC-type sugar transport system ATPase subunit